MAEEGIFFESGDVMLEGLLDRGPSDAGVVITHPHPQYGGSMHNNVVEALANAYGQARYSTLRFNFRGVGKSAGQYDQGVGEQTDVQSAVVYLRKMGLATLHLVGYSFGSWVNAQAVGRLVEPVQMVMVSPPVNFMDFSFLKYTPWLELVIAGSEDDIAPPNVIRDMMLRWNERAVFRTIQGADHFYLGVTGKIESILLDFLKQP